MMKKKKKPTKKPEHDAHIKAYQLVLPMLSYKAETRFSIQQSEAGEWEVAVEVPVAQDYQPFLAFSKIRTTTDPFEIASHVLALILHAESEVAKFFFKVDGQRLPKTN